MSGTLLAGLEVVALMQSVYVANNVINKQKMMHLKLIRNRTMICFSICVLKIMTAFGSPGGNVSAQTI